MSRETLIVIFFICSVAIALWFFFSPEIAKASDKRQIKEYRNGLERNANFINFIMNELLKLDMQCRRIWGITLKQSDLKYNKTFDPK